MLQIAIKIILFMSTAFQMYNSVVYPNVYLLRLPTSAPQQRFEY